MHLTSIRIQGIIGKKVVNIHFNVGRESIFLYKKTFFCNFHVNIVSHFINCL